MAKKPTASTPSPTPAPIVDVPYYGITLSADLIQVEIHIPAFAIQGNDGKAVEPLGVLLAEIRTLFLFAKDSEVQKKFKAALLQQLTEELK